MGENKQMRIRDLPSNYREQAMIQIAEKSRNKSFRTQEKKTKHHKERFTDTEKRHDRMNGTEHEFSMFAKSKDYSVVIYEPFSMWCAGGLRYTPDFLIVKGEQVIIVEVKGSYRLQSEGRARLAFLSCSERYNKLLFLWAKREREGHWKLEFFKGGNRVKG